MELSLKYISLKYIMGLGVKYPNGGSLPPPSFMHMKS